MTNEWQGELWLSGDCCVLVGRSGDTQAHAHYAHQLLLGQGTALRLLVDGEVLSGGRLFIESMRNHAFIETGQALITVYAEPQAWSLDDLRPLLVGDFSDWQGIARYLRDTQRSSLDRRVSQALQRIDERLGDKVVALDLARDVCLSLSQLERLFADQVGLSIRRLVLWRRLKLALSLALAGSTLTEAAHAAGFADLAHLSRTVRSMFGIRAQSLAGLRLLRLDDEETCATDWLE